MDELSSYPASSFNNEDPHMAWATIGVLVRKSEEGDTKLNRKNISWRLNSLEVGATEMILLVPKEAKDVYKSASEGTVLLLKNPRVISKSNNDKQLVLVVDEFSQILELGTSADFDFCSGLDAHGNRCKMAVNRRRGVLCRPHIEAAKPKDVIKKSHTCGSSKDPLIAIIKKKNQRGFINEVSRGTKLATSVGHRDVSINQASPKRSCLSLALKPPVSLPRASFGDHNMGMMQIGNGIQLGSNASISYNSNPISSTPTKISRSLPLKSTSNEKSNFSDTYLNSKLGKNAMKSDEKMHGVPMKLSGLGRQGGQSIYNNNCASDNRFYANVMHNPESNTLQAQEMAHYKIPKKSSGNPLAQNTSFTSKLKDGEKVSSQLRELIMKREQAALSRKMKLNAAQKLTGIKRSLNSTSGNSSLTSGSQLEGVLSKRVKQMSSSELAALENETSIYARGANDEDYQKSMKVLNSLQKKDEALHKLDNIRDIKVKAYRCNLCKSLQEKKGCPKGHIQKIEMIYAIKRFFQCKTCGNKSFSLNNVVGPTNMCPKCGKDNWHSCGAYKGSVIADREEKFLTAMSDHNDHSRKAY